MKALFKYGRRFALGSSLLALALAALAAEKPLPEKKKTLGNDKFTGIIHRAPADGIGSWQVGTHTFESDHFTRLDTFNTPLATGKCALVILRGNRALQIVVLEPLDC